MKKIFLIIVLLIMSSFFCSKDTKNVSADNIKKVSIGKSVDEEYRIPTNPISKEEISSILENLKKQKIIGIEPGEVGIIETKFGTIKIKFYPSLAPVHCAAFKMLARSGFYNGVTFHRVIPGYMIQGGDILTRDENPYNDGNGNPGIRIHAELSRKSHKRGTVSAVRTANKINSAKGQFFICLEDAAFLDEQYTIFGKVIEGMDVVDRIAQVPVNTEDNDRPVEEVIMQRVSVIKE